MESEKSIRSKRGHHLGWWLLILLVGSFVYLSIRPVMRLRPEPPPEFLAMRREWDVRRRAAEDRVARAYWISATQDLQLKYPFGTPLPDRPPPEFRLEGQSVQVGTYEPLAATRARYWKRLQEVWALPRSWEKSYVWDPGRIPQRLVESMAFVGRIRDRILDEFRTWARPP